VESLDSSHKSEKNTESMAQSTMKIKRTTKKIRQRKMADKVIHPQNLTKHCVEVQSELSSISDVDAFNGPFSPIIFENSKFSCITDEPITSKEEITNGPGSPDLSTFFKEIDNYLNCEIKETDLVQGNNSILGDIDDDNLLFQLEAGMDEDGLFGDLGCLDPLWDLDL
jgi:hypothetical protein